MTDSRDSLNQGPHGLDAPINGRLYTRRSVLKGAGALGAITALGPLLAACGSSGSSTSMSPSMVASPKKGGTIRSGIGGGSAKDTLDAHFPIMDSTIAIAWQLYETLVGWDPNHELQMVLAESYEQNGDGTQHTVRLKPDIVFHNGKPVTADDVVYSFNRLLDPKLASPWAGALSPLKSSGISKVDDRTVRFTLDTSNVIFFEGLANYGAAIVPEGYERPRKPNEAIGTGPWKITAFQPAEQADFDANQDYWGEGPYADQLTIMNFMDSTAKLNALMGGTVDHAALIQPSQIPIVGASAGFKTLEAESGTWDTITMRIDKKPFDDQRVRHAFRLIVDRPAMIQQAFDDMAWVGNDMSAPFDPGYPTDLPQREQDLEQAKALLKEAGYDNDLVVTLTTSDGISSMAVPQAQVFAEQAKGAGVTVNLDRVDTAVFWGEMYTNWTFAQSYWATRNYLSTCLMGRTPNSDYNETHWQDAEWEKLLNQALATGDDAARNAIVSEMFRIDYERGGYIVPSFRTSVDAHVDSLQGVIKDNWGGVSACRARYNLMHFAS